MGDRRYDRGDFARRQALALSARGSVEGETSGFPIPHRKASDRRGQRALKSAQVFAQLPPPEAFVGAAVMALAGGYIHDIYEVTGSASADSTVAVCRCVRANLIKNVSPVSSPMVVYPAEFIRSANTYCEKIAK